MKEIIYIILSIPIFFLYFSFPINHFNSKKIITNFDISYYDTVLLNIIINLNILLFCSFFSINLHIVFFFQLLCSLILSVFFFKKYYLYLKNNFIFLSILIVFLIVYFAKLASNPSLTWDGLHWFYKVQSFYQGGDLQNLSSLPMNHYPYLATYTWAFFWKNSFLELEYFGRFFYIFIYLLTLASAINCLNKNYSLLKKILLFVFFVTITSDFYLFGGYQEYLIFCLFYLFSRLFYFFKENKEKNLLLYLMLILIINLFLWIKQEGFFYFFILSFIFLLHGHHSLKKNLFAIGILSLFFLIFYLIKAKFFGGINFNTKIIHDDIYSILNIKLLYSKFLFISKYFFISFFKYPLWICILISLWLLGKRIFIKKNIFIVTFAFLTFSLVYAVYFQSATDHEFLIPVTLSRLLFGLSGFYLIVVINSLNLLKLNHETSKKLNKNNKTSNF